MVGVKQTMKKKIEREEEFCDICELNTSWYKCRICSKSACRQCIDNGLFVVYNEGLYISEDNGHYCARCLSDTSKLNPDEKELLTLYQALPMLTKENENFYESWKNRKDTIETRIRKLYAKLKSPKND